MDTIPITIVARFFDSFNLDVRAKLRLVNRQFKDAIEYSFEMVDLIDFRKASEETSQEYVSLSSRKNFFWSKIVYFSRPILW